MKAAIIKVSGQVIPVVPDNGTDFTLDELHRFISTDGKNPGPCIQIVRLPPHGECMVCEDNGIMIGLPTNPVATAYCAGKVYMEKCGIVGDVLICDRRLIK